MLAVMTTAPARADELDDLVTAQMQAHRVPGAAIAVVRQDRVLLRRDYGLANLETQTPVRPGTVFDLASVTKPFTATAIMLLVQDGKLHLDDPVSAWIADAPEAWKLITIRHLLSHTSGIRGGGWVEADGSPLLHITAQRHLKDFINSPLSFEPGHGAQYSDPGYLLLGMIIEKASGMPYRDFMQQRIFTPSGMGSTRIMDRREIVKDHASCYALRDGTIENDRRVWQHDLPSYFGMQSTANDLARWVILLNSGKPLDHALQQQMWQPTSLADGTQAKVDGELYGLGYFIHDIGAQRAVGHMGFHGSLCYYIPADQLGIIVLTNLDTDSGPHHQQIAMAIFQYLAAAGH